MQTLTKSAQQIFGTLTLDLPVGQSRKFEQSGGVFMPLVVEHLTEGTYSLTLYFESNGDLVPDPDMTFLVTREGVTPLTIQHSTGHYLSAYKEDEGGQLVVKSERAASDLVEFANLWMQNLKEQQGL